MPRKVGKRKVSSTNNFERGFKNFPAIMESTDMQSSFDLRDNIKLEEEVNIQDLALSTDETMEMVQVKEEIIDGTGPSPYALVHEGKITNNFSSSHEWNALLKLEMKNKISKLFEEFDVMSLHDYDLMRVEKTQKLFEKYLQEQSRISGVKEKNLEAEFFTLKQEFENAKSSNLKLQQKIHEYELADGKIPCNNGSLKEAQRIFDENILTQDKIQNATIHEQKKTCKSDHNSSVHENINPKKEDSLSPKQGNPNKFKRKKSIIEEEKISIPCRDCGKKFTRRDNYNRHMATVHERKNSGNHLCQICEKCFSSSDSLKNHVSQVHGGRPLLSCSMCEKKFKTKSGLKDHIDGVHSKKKPFPCNDCGQSFLRKSRLMAHKLKCL